MMGERMKFFLLCLLISAYTIAHVGCKNENTQEPPTKTPLEKVTNLRAYSGSAPGSVGLSWTSSVDVGKVEYTEIQITAKDGNTTYASLTVPKSVTDTLVRGLVEGVIYTFEVVGKAASTTQNLKDSDPATIRWAAARRLTLDRGSEIKVYETASASGASGLILYYAATSEPRAVSVARPGPTDSILIDLYVKTEASGGVSLRSIHLFQNTSGVQPYSRITRFSSEFRDVESLNDPRPAPPDTSTYQAGNTERLIDPITTSSSRIYYFKANDGNYGRILVKRSPSGKLIWGTSPNQYLNLEISYQTRAYVPYAKPVSSNRKRGAN